MPSLNDLLAKAKLPTPSGIRQDVSGQIKNSIRSTSSEIRNIPSGIANSAINSAKGAVTGAVSGGLAGIRGAVDKAIRGDFSGALTQIQNGPLNFMSALGISGGERGGGPGSSPVNPLQGALSRADPMQSFQWYCELPTLSPPGRAQASLPWNYVEEASPPFREFDVRQVYAQGRNRHYAGAYNVAQMPLHFYADIQNQSLQYLKAWQQCILAPFASTDFTKGGGFGRPSDYKKTIRIYLLAPDMSKIMYFELIECWPVNLDSLNLDSGSSTRLTYNVNFSVGDVFTALLAVNSNPVGAGLLDGLKTSATNAISNLIFG